MDIAAQTIHEKNKDHALKLRKHTTTLENINKIADIVTPLHSSLHRHQFDYLNKNFVTILNTKIPLASPFGIFKLSAMLSNANTANHQETEQTQRLTALFKEKPELISLYEQLKNLESSAQVVFNGNTINEWLNATYIQQQPSKKFRRFVNSGLIAFNILTNLVAVPWASSFFSGTTYLSWLGQNATYFGVASAANAMGQRFYNQLIPTNRVYEEAKTAMNMFLSQLKELTHNLQNTLSPLRETDKNIKILLDKLELPEEIEPSWKGIRTLMHALDVVGYLDICVTLAICSKLNTIDSVSFEKQPTHNTATSVHQTFSNLLSRYHFTDGLTPAISQDKNDIIITFKTYDSQATDFMCDLILAKTLGIIHKNENINQQQPICLSERLDLSHIITSTSCLYSTNGKSEHIQAIIYSIN
jgi:hypothetical protein